MSHETYLEMEKACNSEDGGVSLMDTETHTNSVVATQTENTGHKYTEQQINDYCEKVLNLCLVARTDGSLMFESAQIIRQLQEQVRNPDFGTTGN